MAFASYTAYRHLLTKDPLVEAFYKIAGGEKEYQALPELKPKEKQKQTYEYADQDWSKLEHPKYRFLTKDGRKGLLVKGLSYLKTLPPFTFKGASPSNTKKIMIFVEKLDFTDISRKSNNVPKWITDILFGVTSLSLSNPYHGRISAGDSCDTHSLETHQEETWINGWISTDMANELIAQQGVVNQLAPAGPTIEEVKT